MGFVTKLLSFFIPVIIAMIFYYQRDHILSKEQNDYLDAQMNRITLQFDNHIESIKNQLDQIVTEKKDLVGTKDDKVEFSETVKSESYSDTKFDESKTESKSNIMETVQDEELKVKENMKLNENLEKESVKKCNLGKDLLISKDQLSNYNGENEKKNIYLAFLGIVYDVSKGEQHYAPGGAYSMFTGKDASRAFITGDFSENGLTDDLTNLNYESFNGVKEWSDFYENTYRRVGRLIGAFYDENGCPTQQFYFVEEQLKKLNEVNLNTQYDNELFPPCNTEWNKSKKETRFWCTENSGGVQRDWIGLPRQLFSLENKNDFRCACVRDFGPQTKNAIEYADEEENLNESGSGAHHEEENTGDLKNPRVREFEDCHPRASECIIKDKD